MLFALIVAWIVVVVLGIYASCIAAGSRAKDEVIANLGNEVASRRRIASDQRITLENCAKALEEATKPVPRRAPGRTKKQK